MNCFNVRVKSHDGLQSYCRKCHNKHKRALYLREDNKQHRKSLEVVYKERLRAWNLKKKYGMTVGDYELLLASQGGCCAMCGTDNPGKGRAGTDRDFAVDHEHATGKVRALLCHRCNMGLGLLGDNPAEAADMLRSYANISNPIDAEYY